MAKEKVDYKDHMNLPLEKWNSTTFKEYLKHLNYERFGVKPVLGNPKIENIQINNLCKEYGKEVVKLFIEESVSKYPASSQYPSCNWYFMFTFMRTKVLEQIQYKLRNQKVNEITVNNSMTEDDMINYF
jgi:hypothetical protein